MKESVLFSIYQLKSSVKSNDDFIFMNSEYWTNHKKQVNLADYEEIETSVIYSDENETTEQLLDRIYELYNFNKPEYYKHRSVCVSDIILLYMDERKYYFVDSIGFKQLKTANIFDF